MFREQMRRISKISAEVHEEIIKMHLMDWSNVAISDHVGVSYCLVEKTVNNFEKSVRSSAYFPEALLELKQAEAKLDALIAEINSGELSDYELRKKNKEFMVLMRCYASADINNRCVFIP